MPYRDSLADDDGRPQLTPVGKLAASCTFLLAFVLIACTCLALPAIR